MKTILATLRWLVALANHGDGRAPMHTLVPGHDPIIKSHP